MIDSKKRFSSTRRWLGNVLVLCCILFPFVAYSLGAKEYLDHTFIGNTLQVQTTEGAIQITPLSQAAVEVLYLQDDNTTAPSFAISPDLKRPAFGLYEEPGALLLLGKELRVEINKAPISIAFFHNDVPLLSHESGFFQHKGLQGVRFNLQKDEFLIGGGQRVLGMNRRGHRLPLYNKTHWGYTTESSQMYFGLPALLSSNGYGLIFDNAAKGFMDLGASDSNVMQFEAVAGRNAYILVTGIVDNKVDYPQLINNFTEITGRQPLPPAWAFGNFASRFGYRSEKQVREVVKQYQDADIPLDTVVLDLYWFGPEMQGHMGNLDWDRENWPTPENMIADFKDQGIQTVVITEPFILNTSKNWQSAVDNAALATDMSGKKPRVFDMFFGTAGLVDVFSESGQQWFWQRNKDILSQGIAGVWGDLGEPEVHPENTLHAIGTANEVHNAYGHRWAQLLYENHLRDFPDDRLFLLMRSGFVGSQRFGMIPWTGDVSRSWGGLKPQVELTLQMGMLGLAYTHSDLGGFGGGEDVFDKEMYIRWLQYGVFQPVYRPHAFESVPSEPVFHDQQTQDILRGWIKLRYRLFPYNYSLAYENATTGMPLMRPVYFAEPDNIDLLQEKASYLWGDAFFVHPVTEPGVDSVTTRIPKGIWFNFWNNEVVEGGKEQQVAVSLNTIPLFVKAGSFVPFSHSTKPLSQYRGDALDIHYYHHDSVSTGTGLLYEDDGKNRDSLTEALHLTHLSAAQSPSGLNIEINTEGQGFPSMVGNRTIRFSLINVDTQNVKGIRVTQKGHKVPHLITSSDNENLRFSFDWNNLDVSIQIITNNSLIKEQIQ
ncbi:glycoside hydrolase family 31 protein [Planctobacterium marinum]|uniref:glycoside hydrolase family 31 protein n=1 Tax=Planctobacterium marinum TaxID=1631968 RepID=UPI001E340B48|nr:TIM-barrel domain-containing protein [Planctobacterium marinum]MCC2604315.1 DUF5110 domain-containing protein [Planctobacterium marinum]